MKIDCSPLYLDTSALAKLYVQEHDSGLIESTLVGRRDLLVSDLAVTELTSALGRRVRMGDISAEDAGSVYQGVLHDLEEGQFRWLTLTAGVHRTAEQLLLSVGRISFLRAADALHVACAVSVAARGIVTFDRRMREAVSEFGVIEVHPRL